MLEEWAGSWYRERTVLEERLSSVSFRFASQTNRKLSFPNQKLDTKAPNSQASLLLPVITIRNPALWRLGRRSPRGSESSEGAGSLPVLLPLELLGSKEKSGAWKRLGGSSTLDGLTLLTATGHLPSATLHATGCLRGTRPGGWTRARSSGSLLAAGHAWVFLRVLVRALADHHRGLSLALSLVCCLRQLWPLDRAILGLEGGLDLQEVGVPLLDNIDGSNDYGNSLEGARLVKDEVVLTAEDVMKGGYDRLVAVLVLD